MKDHAGFDKIHITIRLYSMLVENYYTDNKIFRSKNYAAERAAEIYPHLRELALDSLKGMFEKKEIELLIEIFKLDREPRFVTSINTLTDKIKEHIKFMNLAKEDKNVIEKIISKIQKLDSFKVIVFTEWLVTYISFGGVFKGKSKVKIKFDDYVKRLLSDN